ncbi:hypothetical protein FOMPIDRAFT_1063008 [Fomitopsis schrenkii]|uniref:Uncharacterized protein n=1 Tax=Fomitopsis schrenkii TaxID=2126942 RepID=S8F7K7_FOMSC|nr:hypothetical protein FOMPIDRAFT_1063008 [Fomitopsis schrenkii]
MAIYTLDIQYGGEKARLAAWHNSPQHAERFVADDLRSLRLPGHYGRRGDADGRDICDALAALPHVGLACTRAEYQAFDRRLAGLDISTLDVSRYTLLSLPTSGGASSIPGWDVSSATTYDEGTETGGGSGSASVTDNSGDPVILLPKNAYNASYFSEPIGTN